MDAWGQKSSWPESRRFKSPHRQDIWEVGSHHLPSSSLPCTLKQQRSIDFFLWKWNIAANAGKNHSSTCARKCFPKSRAIWERRADRFCCPLPFAQRYKCVRVCVREWADLICAVTLLTLNQLTGPNLSLPAQSKYRRVKGPTVALMSLPSPCVHSCSLFRSYWAHRLKICPLGSSSSSYFPCSISALKMYEEIWRHKWFSHRWVGSRSPLSSCSRNSQKDVAVTEADLHHSAVPDERNQTFLFFCVSWSTTWTQRKIQSISQLAPTEGCWRDRSERGSSSITWTGISETYKLACISPTQKHTHTHPHISILVGQTLTLNL